MYVFMQSCHALPFVRVASFMYTIIHAGILVDFGNQDIEVISEVLKMFLKELPNPLIPFSLYNKFIEAGSE